MSNKKKNKGKKTKRLESTARPVHAHPHIQAVPENGQPVTRYCDKEGCGAVAGGSGALCDRHDLAIRAVVSHYLQPSIAAEAWQELLANATAMGFKVDWHDLAEVREVSTPLGWACAICGGTMEPLITQKSLTDEAADTRVVQWEHTCDPDAYENWMRDQAQRLLGSSDPEERARVIVLDGGENDG